MEVSGHLYIIREREFLKTKESIYKVGKSTCIQQRMNSYPKGSRIELIVYIDNNIHLSEKKLLTELRTTFTQRTDIGAEYFESDLYTLKKRMCEALLVGNKLHI